MSNLHVDIPKYKWFLDKLALCLKYQLSKLFMECSVEDFLAAKIISVHTLNYGLQRQSVLQYEWLIHISFTSYLNFNINYQIIICYI